MPKISRDDVKAFFVEGAKAATGLAATIYGNSINLAADEAFSDAIEIGISNTVAALYDTEVSDLKIVHALNDFWGINRDEAEKRLIHEKRQAVIRALENHLKMQGNSAKEIREFMRINKVTIKLNHNSDLWELRRNPKELIKAIRDC